MTHENLTGTYTASELEELNDISAYGGTTPSSWPCGIGITTTICPTAACSSKCR